MPNWYKKVLKLADKNSPRAFDPQRPDPYKRKMVGDGEGDKLTTPGELGGYGTRFRGDKSPKGFSSTDETEMRDDIPTPYNTLIENYSDGDKEKTNEDPKIGVGAGDGGFADPSEPLSRSQQVARDLNGNPDSPAYRINGIPVRKAPKDVYKDVAISQSTKLL